MLALLAALLVWPATANEPQPPTKHVLLNNGGVLHGVITLGEGKYRLATEHGEIQLPRSSVARVAGSLVELYEWRRDHLTGPTAVDKFRLADWCIDQQLWPQAAQQLLAIRVAEPEHPRLQIAERRLEEAWRQSQAPPTAVREPIDRQMLQTARAAQQLQLVESLPPGTLEEFTRRVQPILVNNCTLSGCHAPGNGEPFPLNRHRLHGLADRRSTFANLASVLAAIDRQNPSASPLLRAANEPHGGSPTGRLTGRREALADAVQAWVEAVARPASPSVAQVQPSPRAAAQNLPLVGGGFQTALPPGYGRGVTPAATYAQAAAHGAPGTARPIPPATPPHAPRAQHDPRVTPAGYSEPIPREAGSPAPPQPFVAGEETFAPLPTRPVRRGANLQRVDTPTDEFDPAVFNRRYHEKQ